jgi:hypothetical protein
MLYLVMSSTIVGILGLESKQVHLELLEVSVFFHSKIGLKCGFIRLKEHRQRKNGIIRETQVNNIYK